MLSYKKDIQEKVKIAGQEDELHPYFRFQEELHTATQEYTAGWYTTSHMHETASTVWKNY